MAGWSFARMLGGVVVIETVFNLPGLGLLLVSSVALRDYDVVGAMVVLLGTVFLTINLVVDILYGVVDPRIRLA
jgi:ABC-type dipeptide/oligopeptide/nickel transport system permease component